MLFQNRRERGDREIPFNWVSECDNIIDKQMVCAIERPFRKPV